MTLVKRVPILLEPEAAEFLGWSRGTLRNKRSRNYKGPRGPVYRKMPSGKIGYRLDDLERHRDSDARYSTTEAVEQTT